MSCRDFFFILDVTVSPLLQDPAFALPESGFYRLGVLSRLPPEDREVVTGSPLDTFEKKDPFFPPFSVCLSLPPTGKARQLGARKTESVSFGAAFKPVGLPHRLLLGGKASFLRSFFRQPPPTDD